MCEHLGQAATETMGRDLKTTVDWSLRFGRNTAVIGEHFAASCFQSNASPMLLEEVDQMEAEGAIRYCRGMLHEDRR